MLHRDRRRKFLDVTLSKSQNKKPLQLNSSTVSLSLSNIEPYKNYTSSNHHEYYGRDHSL